MDPTDSDILCVPPKYGNDTVNSQNELQVPTKEPNEYCEVAEGLQKYSRTPL